MKSLSSRSLMLVTLMVAGVLATGCARKAQQAPPTPPPAQPQATTPAPAPTPTPTPTPAPPPETTPQVAAGDFQPAFFDFDSYALRDDARAALDQDARLLRDHPEIGVTLEGHCDERGTVEYNQALGEKRAQAARDYLVNAGIPASRLQTVSYGKERPFDPGHDESAWAKNRRAHFTLR
jgi:peptidoglycan-associated lipoprotein